MVLGVPVALLSTGRAGTDAGHEQVADGHEIPLARSRQKPRGDITDVGAGQIERDAGAERGDVLLDEVGVRAYCAGLNAGQAGVDRPSECRPIDWKMRGGGIEDLESVSHAPMTAPPERATTTDRAESICVSYGLRSRQRHGRSPSGCAGISGALGIADRTSRPVRMRCSGHQSRSLLRAGGSGFHLNPAASSAQCNHLRAVGESSLGSLDADPADGSDDRLALLRSPALA